MVKSEWLSVESSVVASRKSKFVKPVMTQSGISGPSDIEQSASTPGSVVVISAWDGRGRLISTVQLEFEASSAAPAALIPPHSNDTHASVQSSDRENFTRNLFEDLGWSMSSVSFFVDEPGIRFREENPENNILAGTNLPPGIRRITEEEARDIRFALHHTVEFPTSGLVRYFEDEFREPQRIARDRTTLELVSQIVQNPGPWLRTPNSQFDNRPPIDLIGTDEEFRVRNVLHAVEQGLY